MFHLISLRKSITIFTILLVIASVSSITFILTLSSRQIIKDDFAREQKQVLNNSQSKLVEFIKNQEVSIDAWATQPIVGIHFTVPGLGTLSLPGVKTYFSKIGQSAPWIDSILLIEGDEIIVTYSQSTLVDDHLRNRELFLNAPDISVVNIVYTYGSLPEVKLLLKREFPEGGEGDAGNYIAVLVDPNAVQLKLFQSTKLGLNGFVRLLLETPNDRIWAPTLVENSPPDNGSEYQKFQLEARSWNDWTDIGTEDFGFQITLKKVIDESIAIAAVISKQELLSPINSQIQLSIILGIIILVSGVLVAIYLTSKLTRPLLEFVGNVNKVEFEGEGVVGFTTQHSGYTEIRHLNKAFTDMFDKLALSSQQLSVSEKQLRNMFENNEIAILSEDFTKVIERLDQLRLDGITNLRQYLQDNEEEVNEIASMVSINGINNTALQLYNAKTELDFLNGIGELFGGDAHKIFCEELVSIWDKKQFFRSGASQKTFDGKNIDVVISMPIPESREGFKAIPVSIIDITEQKKAEKGLKANDEKYRSLVESAPISIFQLDMDGHLISMNKAGLKMISFGDEREVVGLPYLNLVSEEDRDRIANHIDDAFNESYSEFEFRGLSGIEFSGSFVGFHRINGNVNRLLGIAQDITTRNQALQSLSFQASHDALTGLINRHEFEKRVTRLLASRVQDSAEHAMCFLDLDQFKIINDTCGHVAGDELLRQVGRLLGDTVRNRDTLARLGGDEFGVLMEHCTLEQAHRTANDILEAIMDHQFYWDDKIFRIGVSIGLVAITETGGSFTDLFQQADAACFLAKDLGRNRIHSYHPDDTELAIRHGEMQWVGRIHQALSENRFCLFAQPIVSLENGDSLHYELLLRMLGDDDDIIPPGAFLPAAERYNLIEAVDTWVVERAISILDSHSDFIKQVKFISINLSGQSLANAQFMPMVNRLIADSNIDARKICFEITETAAISNLHSANVFISALKDLGCRFALDDFGSGLSSFRYLKNIPVDYLKIDGMFVKDMINDSIDEAMVKSINDIGHVMGMKTIAEFVESDVIKAKLEEIGVDYAQGYEIGKPEPFEDVIKRFDTI